jgi:hypothetical protein
MKSLPSSQREELATVPYTREWVLKVVEKAIADSEKDRFRGMTGKLKQHFHKICGTIDAHSKPLEMLPSSSAYCSIFYGAIITVLHVFKSPIAPLELLLIDEKASVNHQTILKAIPEAIVDINYALSGIDKQVWLYPTEQIKLLVQKFYTETFRFLIEAMKWYSSAKRRLMGSFNEGLHDQLKGYLATVLQTAEHIKTEAQSGLFAEVRHLRMHMEDLKSNHQMTMDVLAKDTQERQETRRIIEELCERQRRVDIERRKQLDSQKPKLLEDALAKIAKHWDLDIDTMTEQELIGAPATELLLDGADSHLARSGLFRGTSITSKSSVLHRAAIY